MVPGAAYRRVAFRPSVTALARACSSRGDCLKDVGPAADDGYTFVKQRFANTREGVYA